MSFPPQPPAPDPAEEAARLIREVGRSAQEARRYRRLATRIADPTFDRALALGSVVRAELRAGDGNTPGFAAVMAELRTLLEGCEHAIAEVRCDEVYREAAAGFTAGAVERVAALAPAIFTDVAAGCTAATLFWPFPIAGRRSDSHFLAPAECAERIHAAAAAGIEAQDPPPGLGADDAIGAVVLAAEPDVVESPITVVIDRAALSTSLCHLEGTASALYYAPRLRAPFVIRCAALVHDEWWAVRPDAYRDYVNDLRNALGAYGIQLEIER